MFSSRFNSKIDEQTGYVTKNIVCAPVRTVRGDLIGVIQILNKKRGRFTKDDLDIVQGITLREVSVHDVRKHLMGRSPRGEGTKELVMQAVRERGFQPTDDNEADAIAGWLYAESEFFRVRNGQKPNPQKNLI